MAMNSARSEIYKVLCDKNIFQVGYEGYSWDYASVIKGHLPSTVINSVKDIDNSIREALETVDGYTYSNGTICYPKMGMRKTKIVKPEAPNKYYILYKVL